MRPHTVSSLARLRVGTLFVAIVMTAASVMADAISITSPDHAQTFAYGSMIGHQFYRGRTGGELVARITFSNLPYYDDDQPRRDESFDFRFPSVQYDSRRNTFFASSSQGRLIAVAGTREFAWCGWVDLAPGAKMYLMKESGRVTAVLTATNYARAGTRWVQMDNNFSLQNILVALFGDFRTR